MPFFIFGQAVRVQKETAKCCHCHTCMRGSITEQDHRLRGPKSQRGPGPVLMFDFQSNLLGVQDNGRDPDQVQNAKTLETHPCYL